MEAWRLSLRNRTKECQIANFQLRSGRAQTSIIKRTNLEGWHLLLQTRLLVEELSYRVLCAELGCVLKKVRAHVEIPVTSALLLPTWAESGQRICQDVHWIYVPPTLLLARAA